jgi:hypothetical protein
MMQIHIPAEEQLAREIPRETIIMESDRLARSGFLSDEIASLLWLRQWYQGGGSDRAQLVRHWEFLKFLVMTGKLAV